jgi:hypothetical protein
MQISKLTADIGGPLAPSLTADIAAAARLLNDRDGDLVQQLDAYQGLAGRWREARHGERAALAEQLTETVFAQRVHSVLNAFSRAAWAGPDAVPPAPQAQALRAFEDLAPEDQQIVAALHVDPATGAGYASPADYRSRLLKELDAALPRRSDSVTLSAEAHARLEAQVPPPPLEPSAASDAPATVAAALHAYAKAAGD